MKISIIIPTFNRPEFLPKAINSALPIQDSEIIIVDDLSNEDTRIKNRTFVDSLVTQGENIRLIEAETKLNISEARNTGIREAKGEWLFFLDDDDAILENFAEWLNSKETISNEDVLRFKYLRNGKPFSRVYKKNYFWSVQPSTFLIKRKFVLDNNLFFEKNYLYQDNIFAAIIYDKKKTALLPYEKKVASINYYLSQTSVMRSETKTIEHWEKTFNFFQNSNLMLKEQWMIKMFCEAYKFVKHPTKIKNKTESLVQLREMQKKIKNKKIFWTLPFYFKYFYIESKIYLFFKKR